MKKFISLIAVFVYLSATIFAKDLRRKAEQNPLDCAFYLLLQEKPEDRSDNDIFPLAEAYFELNQPEKIIGIINLLENSTQYSRSDDRVNLFVHWSTRFLESGKRTEANVFLTEAIKNLDKQNYPDTYSLEKLIKNLIELNRYRETFKIAEMFAAEFEENNVTLAVAENLIKKGEIEKLRNFSTRPFFPHNSENNLTRAEVALTYAKLDQNEEAKNIITKLEQKAFTGETEIDSENNRREMLLSLLRVHLALGEIDKAFELWNQYGDQNNYYECSSFANDLTDYGQKEKASLLLFQMKSDKKQFERQGSYVVKSYLKLGDVDSALYAAKNMSDATDNYSQQDSLMAVADNFIEKGGTNEALDVLDFAFQRARKIKFEHEYYQSNGASSGTRKRNYLRNIYVRLMKLNKYDKALTVINSVDSSHWIAKEFQTDSLADFVKKQSQTMSHREIAKIIKQIQDLNLEDEDYYSIQSKLLTAEIYALIGEKVTAANLIAEILKEAKESCCYKKDFLITAGKIFTQYDLKANADIKKHLREYLDD